MRLEEPADPDVGGAVQRSGVRRVDPRRQLQRRGCVCSRFREMDHVAGVHPAAGEVDVLPLVRAGCDDGVMDVRRPVLGRGLVPVAVGREEAQQQRDQRGRTGGGDDPVAGPQAPDHDPKRALRPDRRQVGGGGVAPRRRRPRGAVEPPPKNGGAVRIEDPKGATRQRRGRAYDRDLAVRGQARPADPNRVRRCRSPRRDVGSGPGSRCRHARHGR
jgi:hypothetical protein